VHSEQLCAVAALLDVLRSPAAGEIMTKPEFIILLITVNVALVLALGLYFEIRDNRRLHKSIRELQRLGSPRPIRRLLLVVHEAATTRTGRNEATEPLEAALAFAQDMHWFAAVNTHPKFTPFYHLKFPPSGLLQIWGEREGELPLATPQ